MSGYGVIIGGMLVLVGLFRAFFLFPFQALVSISLMIFAVSVIVIFLNRVTGEYMSREDSIKVVICFQLLGLAGSGLLLSI